MVSSIKPKSTNEYDLLLQPSGCSGTIPIKISQSSVLTNNGRVQIYS
jgi:hypothetical protein